MMRKVLMIFFAVFSAGLIFTACSKSDGTGGGPERQQWRNFLLCRYRPGLQPMYNPYLILYAPLTVVAMPAAAPIREGLLPHTQKCLQKKQIYGQPFLPEPCLKAALLPRHRSMLSYAGSTPGHQIISQRFWKNIHFT